REMFGYPPFGSMIRIIVRGPQQQVVAALAAELAQRASAAVTDLPDLRVLGPAPAPLMKQRDHFRYHLLIQATQLEPVKQLLREAQASLKLPPDTLWQADIDPIDML
ncbi:MAG: hypothetical protein KDB23_27615, partial [Planctomycetales bacterium]|nr:hypothetical protein [Planctomycetales bacterium]